MVNKSPFLSICIPTWEVRGAGAEYLEHTLNILANQTFTNFNIINTILKSSIWWRDICFDLRLFRGKTITFIITK